MTEPARQLPAYLKKAEYRREQTPGTIDVSDGIRGKSDLMRDALRFRVMLRNETPKIFPYDNFGSRRSRVDFACYTDETGRRSDIRGAPGTSRRIPPPGALALGMDGLWAELLSKREADGGVHADFYAAAPDYADRYREFAENHAPETLYRAFCRVPHEPPESFYEACVFLQFIIFTLRCTRLL